MDLRFKVGHPKRYPIDWIFCSRRCQDCFHRLYAAGVRSLEREGSLQTGVGVIDPTEAELTAMQQCLKPLGEAASAIGMDRPLSSYTQQEALQLINAQTAQVGVVRDTYARAMSGRDTAMLASAESAAA